MVFCHRVGVKSRRKTKSLHNTRTDKARNRQASQNSFFNLLLFKLKNSKIYEERTSDVGACIVETELIYTTNHSSFHATKRCSNCHEHS